MDPVVVVASAAGLMWLAEQLRPGVALPRASFWLARVVALNAAQVAVVYTGALTWDRWFPELRLVDGSVLGFAAGTAVGYLAVTFVFYWWHRARHEVPLLWLLLHQVHHSPVRIEVLTSFYKHPLEIALNGLITSALLYGLLGLPAATTAAVMTLTGIAELVYHWNISTPHWLGYFFQRPESHRHHHRRDWHRDNYSDLPLWDMLFGTFHNPRATPPECGFADEAETKLLSLLRARMPQ